MAIIYFKNEIPEMLHCFGGRITREPCQSKDGGSSLRWDFSKGDRLVLDTDIGYRDVSPGENDNLKYTFGIHIFGISAEGKLHFSFRRSGEEKTGFDVRLGFTGWRCVMVCFDRDMLGKAENDMDSLEITADGEGAVLLDEIVTCGKIDQRYVMHTYQVPHIKNGLSPIIHNPRLPEKYNYVRCDIDAVESIKRRVGEYLNAEFLSREEKSLDRLNEKMQTINIRSGELGLFGKRIEFEGRVANALCTRRVEFVNLGYVGDLLLDIAVRFIKTADKAAEDMYFTLYGFLISQGFDEGSGFGTHMILDYGLRNVYISIMLMRKSLEKRGMIEKTMKIMRWFLHMDAFGFAEDTEERKATFDDFFNISQGILFYILLMPDINVQCRYLKAFSDWIDRSLKHTKGLEGMLKSDGCIYHHHGHYIAYGQCGLSGIAPVVYAISNTAFDISEESRQNMKNALKTLRFQCSGSYVPIVFAGRHPTGEQRLGTRAFKYFALSSLIKHDAEGCGLYIGLVEKPSDELDKRIFDACGEHSAEISGNNSYPMACAAVHKHKGITAIAKGFSKYLWGSEIYLENNLYGRYRSYGTLELIGENPPFSQAGYDWNRFPGTTAIYLPYDRLKADVRKLDWQSGFEEMLLSDQSFAGGISLNGNGMFSMILTEHPKYNGTHRANKSIFFYEDFILCLGSDICNKSDCVTETTLYQDSIFNNSHNALLNGKLFCGKFTVGEKDVISDTRGNLYYVKEKTELLINSGVQKSPLSTGKGDGEGRFASAVICHGKNPKNQSYEYAIGLNGARKRNYRVLKQDSKAHIVKIENITYYAIFKPEKFDAIKSNLPVLIMLQETDCGYEAAVCNPDLGLYDCDLTQYDADGTRKEVSIYSRQWVHNEIKPWQLEVEFKEIGLTISTELAGGEIYRCRTENRKKGELICQ